MTGFLASAAQGLGIASDYHADPAKPDYNSLGGGAAAQAQTADYGNRSNASFGQGDTYAGDAQNALYDPRIAADYGRATQQVGPTYYNGGLAKLLYQQGTDQAIAGQMAAAHSSNPNGRALANYTAANNAGALQQSQIGQAALAEQQMRAQYDAMNAQTALANRGQNLGLLGLSQQNAQGDAGILAGLAGQQYGNGQYYGSAQQGANALAQQGQIANGQISSGNTNAANAINAGVAQNAASAGSNLLGAGLGAAAGVATGGMSLLAGNDPNRRY